MNLKQKQSVIDAYRRNLQAMGLEPDAMGDVTVETRAGPYRFRLFPELRNIVTGKPIPNQSPWIAGRFADVPAARALSDYVGLSGKMNWHGIRDAVEIDGIFRYLRGLLVDASAQSSR